MLRKISRAVGDLWLRVGLALVLIVALEVTSTAVLAVASRPGAADPRMSAEAYRDAPWAAAYFREFQASDDLRWESYVYWRRRPFAGQFINIGEDGLRRTVRPVASLTEDPVRIFVFGGSTVWGTGARDEFTIPSALARALATDSPRGVDVTSFGETGYVTTQEVIALERELQKGVRPDIVIFYDGVNDTFSGIQHHAPGLPQNEINRVVEFNLLQRARRLDLFGEGFTRTIRESASYRLGGSVLQRFRPPDRVAPITVSELLAADIVNTYVENLRIVESLGQRYGFTALFYWQPMIFTKERLSPYEREQADAFSYAAESYRNVYRAVELNMALMADSNFHNLATLFRNDERPLFIDFAHLSELGNELIASRMAVDVRAARTKSPVR